MLPRTFQNGKFIDTKDLTVAGTDLSIHRGYGIFDFFKLRNRTNPWIDWYMERFENSLQRTRLSIHMGREEVLSIMDQLLSENKVDDAYVKIVVTAGFSTNGYTRKEKENVLLFAMPLRSTDINLINTGVLISDNYRRDIPDVKTTNYIRSCILQPEMEQVGAIDVLYHWNGIISEASRSNIFIGKNGKFTTPGENILRGITRRRVLNLNHSDIKIEEREIGLQEVFNADEIFITSSTKGIMPIIKIDDRQIGSGHPGPMSLSLLQDINTF